MKCRARNRGRVPRSERTAGGRLRGRSGVLQNAGARRAKPGRRLVEQHDLRLERQRHREFQRLLQSVAQETGLLMQTFGQPGGFQHGACSRGWPACSMRRVTKGARALYARPSGNRPRSRFRTPKPPGIKPSPRADDAVPGQAVDRPPHDLDRAIRALAGIGRARTTSSCPLRWGDEAGEFAPARGERYVRKNRQASEALGQPGDFDDHILCG